MGFPRNVMMARWLRTAGVFALCVAASAQGVRLIYSAVSEPGRERRWPGRIHASKADEVVMNEQVLPAARRAWRGKDPECDEAFRIVGAAQGSFTRPKAVQEAVLYTYCATGHNFARNGLAIIENGELVAHVVYAGAWDHDLFPVKDLDGSGLTAMLTVTGGANMGQVWETVSIVELDGDDVKKFGRARTVEDACEASPAGPRQAYRLFAKPGSRPLFFLEAFQKPCSGAKRWAKTRAIKQITLEEDEVDYVRLK